MVADAILSSLKLTQGGIKHPSGCIYSSSLLVPFWAELSEISKVSESSRATSLGLLYIEINARELCGDVCSRAPMYDSPSSPKGRPYSFPQKSLTDSPLSVLFLVVRLSL